MTSRYVYIARHMLAKMAVKEARRSLGVWMYPEKSRAVPPTVDLYYRILYASHGCRCCCPSSEAMPGILMLERPKNVVNLSHEPMFCDWPVRGVEKECTWFIASYIYVTENSCNEAEIQTGDAHQDV